MRVPAYNRNLIPTKWLLIGALLTVSITILAVYLTGFTSSRSVLANATISLSILAFMLFALLTSLLYKGLKLKDDIGDLTQKIKWSKANRLDAADVAAAPSGKSSFDFGDVGDADDLLGVILAWLAAAFVIVALLFLFETILTAFVLSISAMFYWVFYRAIRLVLKNRATCKGDMLRSATYGLGYTLLYTSWVYGILLLVKLLK